MKILSNISGTVTEEAWVEPAVYHHTVGVSLPGGAFRSVRVGPDALIVGDGRDQVVVPLAELLRVAEPHLQDKSESVEG